jgi:hypothetical protein
MQCCVCAERSASRLIRPSGQTPLLSFRQYLNRGRLELPWLARWAALDIAPADPDAAHRCDPSFCDVNEHGGTARIRGDKSIAPIGVKIDDGTGSSRHSLLLAQQLVGRATVAAGLADSTRSHRCLIRLIAAPVG